MGIEILSTGGPDIERHPARPGATPVPDSTGKTFTHDFGPEFGSYEHVLGQNLTEARARQAPDITFHRTNDGGEELGVKVTVGENSVIVRNLLGIAPTTLASTIVSKALALGAITLPSHLRPFIKAQDMIGGDLGAIIMGRFVHITPSGAIYTPPRRMIGGRDSWHIIKENDIPDLIIPEVLHGGLTDIEIKKSGLEGTTWKEQKIRIRPSGKISVITKQGEKEMPEDEVVNLVVPNALIGKVRWNGEPHSLPLFGDVGASYICIKEGGIVEVMLKGPGANYRKLNEAQIRKLVEQAKEKERKDKVDEGKRRERLTSMLKKWPKAS